MTADPTITTMAVTVVGGVGCQMLARRFRIPSIVPLLAAGVVLGPAGLAWVQPRELGDGLRALVGFAVAIILFEGGLSLKLESFRFAGRAIRNLVVGGALVTWTLAATAAVLLFPELGVPAAVLFGALVIVTGPTVIAPLLHAVRPRRRLANVLRGEAILIDPVGAFCAVLVLEFMIGGDGGGLGPVLIDFGERVLLGLVIGGAGALILDQLVRRQQALAPDMKNLTVLAGAMGLYALSESLASESGVLTVTLSGFLLGWRHPPGVEEVEEFKGHITVLMVSMVFILLAADLSVEETLGLGWPGIALVAALILVVRPATVFLSTIGTELSLREKLFLSWIAPRGIVAAAVSSLFAIVLERNGMMEGRLVLSLTFATIAATVVVAGLTARPVGRLLGVLEDAPNGVLLVGANQVGRPLARALSEAGVRALVVDTNPWRVQQAVDLGLKARHANVLDEIVMEELDTDGIGHLLALTPNDAINRLAVRLYRREYGDGKVRAIRLENSPELGENDLPHLFESRLEWHQLERRIKKGDIIQSATVDQAMRSNELDALFPGAIPLLAVKATGELHFLKDEGSSLAQGETLLYLAPPEAEEGSPQHSPDS